MIKNWNRCYGNSWKVDVERKAEGIREFFKFLIIFSIGCFGILGLLSVPSAKFLTTLYNKTMEKGKTMLPLKAKNN